MPVFTKKENATLEQRIEILDWYRTSGKTQDETAEHFDKIKFRCSELSLLGLKTLLVGTHYCLAVGNDEGLELDETGEDEELCEVDEEEAEENEYEDLRGIQSGGGRQENSLRDYSLNSRGLIYKYRVVCA